MVTYIYLVEALGYYEIADADADVNVDGDGISDHLDTHIG